MGKAGVGVSLDTSGDATELLRTMLHNNTRREPDAVQLLLEHGADVNVRFPLDAVTTRGRNEEMLGNMRKNYPDGLGLLDGLFYVDYPSGEYPDRRADYLEIAKIIVRSPGWKPRALVDNTIRDFFEYQAAEDLSEIIELMLESGLLPAGDEKISLAASRIADRLFWMLKNGIEVVRTTKKEDFIWLSWRSFKDFSKETSLSLVELLQHDLMLWEAYLQDRIDEEEERRLREGVSTPVEMPKKGACGRLPDRLGTMDASVFEAEARRKLDRMFRSLSILLAKGAKLAEKSEYEKMFTISEILEKMGVLEELEKWQAEQPAHNTNAWFFCN